MNALDRLLAWRRRAWLAAGLLAALAPLAASAAPPVNTLKPGLFATRTDTAILGYDPVAYFTDGKAVKGQDGLVVDWMGAKWKFASQAHLDAFKAGPERYAPQYGGYCAYGVSQGHLVEVEPDKFTIVDGKLYLNLDAEVQARWLKDPAGYIRLADSKFKALLAQ